MRQNKALFFDARRLLWAKDQLQVALNSQFNVALNGIIYFSVQICDNSLLALKMLFQVFSFASKKVQGFSSDRKMLMPLESLLFYLQNLVSVYWNFNFYPRYLGKRSLYPWNQPHFLRNSDKSPLSQYRNKLKEI